MPIDSDEVMVATRLSRSLYKKILKRQQEAKRLLGIEPSVSAVVRAMIEEASPNGKKRRRAAIRERT